MNKLFISVSLLAIILSDSSLAFNIKNARIVGGGLAELNQFPFQVSIRKFGQHSCGGSIISDRWILTAAHCVALGPKILSVVVGSIYLNKDGSTFSVKRTIKHENNKGGLYDIGLIELENPLKFTKSIESIKVSDTEVPINSEITISGWGSVYDQGPISNTLKFNSKMNNIDSNSCAAAIQDKYYEGIICLTHEIGQGTCNGDSGGPAVFNGQLIGLASFGLEGCGTDHPDSYVEVSKFVNWIEQNTGLKL